MGRSPPLSRLLQIATQGGDSFHILIFCCLFPVKPGCVTVPQLITQCPEYSVEDIPSKTIFRASPELVSRRRVQLEKFLQGVVKSDPLATCECTVQVNRHSHSLLRVSILHSSAQFFTPNRERRLLTVYPGSASCNPDGPSESLALDAQCAASARQSAAAVDSAADRYAVDWSGLHP